MVSLWRRRQHGGGCESRWDASLATGAKDAHTSCVASPFPIAPEEITPDWLTGALRDAGAIDDARVTSLVWERIGEGVGFVGQVARITPAYDCSEPDAPASVIGKFPSPLEATRQFAAAYGLYRCEVNVYTQMAPAIPLRVPAATSAR